MRRRRQVLASCTSVRRRWTIRCRPEANSTMALNRSTQAGAGVLHLLLRVGVVFVLFGCQADGIAGAAQEKPGKRGVATTQSGNIQDVWTEPFEGVRYLHRVVEEPRWDIHVCLIDLTRPGIGLVVTKQGDRGMSTDKWAEKKKVQVAINGGMGGKKNGYAEPSGMTMGEGELWTDVTEKGVHDRFGSFAEGVGEKEGERRIAFYEPGVIGK